MLIILAQEVFFCIADLKTAKLFISVLWNYASA
ncbi:hypothetical protein C8N43_0482 [Litoreibacter ponti]|uniref:Uncharacterized protein n=1 Tax=Litoreibacter ponti TaxID=1510457 RepID=A0A2T6BIF4_9RHOB|nr:hypothetical protein C8N43_0482 [Litoreibacter ponti]